MAVQVLMTDPVIAADGYTYERAALVQHLQHSLVSPVTGNMLERTSCVPNTAIKSLLQNSIWEYQMDHTECDIYLVVVVKV